MPRSYKLAVSHPRDIWPILIGVAIGTTVVTTLTTALVLWRKDRRAQLQLEAGVSETALRRVEVVEEEEGDEEGEGEDERERERDEEVRRVIAAVRLHNRSSEGIQLRDLHGQSSLDGAAGRT